MTFIGFNRENLTPEERKELLDLCEKISSYRNNSSQERCDVDQYLSDLNRYADLMEKFGGDVP